MSKHMQKLPQRLILACRRYWFNKAAQHRAGTSGIQWDKPADLQHIDSVSRLTPGLSWVACVGTFWFCKGRVTIKLDETNWQTGGVRTIAKVGSAG